MEMMDEVAFMTATRFSRKRIVTVSSDKIDFKKPIPSGTLVELIGSIKHVGNTSVKVHVDIFTEKCIRKVVIWLYLENLLWFL